MSFQDFLAPIKPWLIDQGMIDRLYDSIDWNSDRFTNPQLHLPSYYTKQNFHGIEGGYLNPRGVATYDSMTQYILFPQESWIRQGLIDEIVVQPKRILDLGCGTGSMTLILKQVYPNAQVIGIDLSPYMLILADHKTLQAKQNIQYQQRLAESTGFPPNSFDLISSSLLLHEVPSDIAQSILLEIYRLLKPGGQTVILEPNQSTLQLCPWLTDIIEEPYLLDYASGSITQWMKDANLAAIKTQNIYGLYQVTRGIKPIPTNEPYQSYPEEFIEVLA